MGGILADCLVGLPLMRELNLRDNRLTDKGLIPIVKVRSSRKPLHDGTVHIPWVGVVRAKNISSYYRDYAL